MDEQDINKRLLEVIDYKAKGNLSKFSRDIDIAHQRISRLFRIDRTSGKYPTVHIEIIVGIAKKYADINIEWILTGSESMLKTKSIKNVIIDNDNKNDNILEENEKYKKHYPLKFDENLAAEGEVNSFKLKLDNNIEHQRIPLYNIEAAAGLVPLFNDIANQTPIDYINIPNLPRCDGAVYVTGDSMYPLLKSGDIVLYRQINDIKNNIFWGEMYLVSVDVEGEEYVTVKYIQKSEISNHIKLVSHNQHHSDKNVDISKIRALAFVKASIRINSMK